LSRRAGPVIAALALLCATCGQPGGTAEKAPAKAKAAPAPAARVSRTERLYLAPGGLELADDWAGTSRSLPFGTPEAATRALVERVTDRPDARTADPHCRVQPKVRLDYPGGLALHFEAGRFVAWEQSADPAYGMRGGIAIDSPRAALGALGPVTLRRIGITDAPLEEFTAGVVRGVLLGGKVQDLGAGRSACP
jgi:hypothetical protein